MSEVAPPDEAKRKGPGGETEAPQDRWAATEDSVPRCIDCGHRIFTAASIAVGIGRDCRRRRRAVIA